MGSGCLYTARLSVSYTSLYYTATRERRSASLTIHLHEKGTGMGTRYLDTQRGGSEVLRLEATV